LKFAEKHVDLKYNPWVITVDANDEIRTDLDIGRSLLLLPPNNHTLGGMGKWKTSESDHM